MVIPSMHCSMKHFFITIVEIHMLILDVCVCLSDAVVQKIVCTTWF